VNRDYIKTLVGVISTFDGEFTRSDATLKIRQATGAPDSVKEDLRAKYHLDRLCARRKAKNGRVFYSKRTDA
jgi:hypothetical protein